MNFRYLIAGVVVSTALVGVVFAARKAQPPPPPVTAPAVSDEKVKGPAQAPVQIAEYSDFQCPACARAQTTLHTIFEKYAGKVRLTYYHFPLRMHQWAEIAHQSAECAHRSGRFWDYHDRLFREQAFWSALQNPVPAFMQYAKDANLDLESFASCLADPAVHAQVKADRARGDGMQINSTPTFFINGERLVGPVEMEAKGEDTVRRILGLPPLPKVAAPVTPAAATAPAASPTPAASPSPSPSPLPSPAA